MPKITSAKQFRFLQAAARGQTWKDGPTKTQAKRMLAETPRATRKRFAQVRKARR